MDIFRSSDTQKPTTETYRQWVKHFSSNNPDSQAQVPLAWSNFFLAQLLNPMNFAWAKNFLCSLALQSIQSGQSLQFSLPPKCLYTDPPVCSSRLSQQRDWAAKAKDIIFEGQSGEDIASSSAAPFIPAHTVQSPPDKEPVLPVKESSPNTPLEKMIERVSTSAGPWSKALLKQADQIKRSQKDGVIVNV